MEALYEDFNILQCVVFRSTSHEARVVIDGYESPVVEELDKITEVADRRFIYREFGGM